MKSLLLQLNRIVRRLRPAGRGQASHAKAPYMGLLGIVLMSVATITVVTAVSAWLALNHLQVRQARQMTALDTRLDRIFQSLSMHADRIQLTTPWACSITATRELSRRSLLSEFGSLFHFVVPGSAEVCGPFGVLANGIDGIVPENRALSHSMPFEIFPGDGVRKTLLIVIRRSDSLEVHVELPLSRLQIDSAIDQNVASWAAESFWSVTNHEGTFLLGASPLVEQGAQAARMSPALRVWRHQSPQYGYRIEGRLTTEQLIQVVAGNAWRILLLSALIVLLVVQTVNRRFAARASPERRMRMAIKKRRIEPVIQPIVCTLTGRCLGGEVLMRWRHPARGLISPYEFIAVAEESGMIVPMSEMMMRKARDQLAQVYAGDPSLYFSFNITAAQLRDPTFPGVMAVIFDGSSLPPQAVVLELTEREAIARQDREAIEQLRSLGFRIALDDFGTGQSSLAMLQGMQIDRIKIDREFVRTIDEGTTCRPVLDLIIQLAKDLRVPMIAEGVETRTQLKYLADRHVESIQGYLFAKPMPVPELEKWLGQQELRIKIEGEAALHAQPDDIAGRRKLVNA